MPRLDQHSPIQLTPVQFELEVKAVLDGLGLGLDGYQSQHREVVGGHDGDYEIDVTVRFTALGANFLVLVECKHYKNPVKRETIQSLHGKVQSLGAQKAVLFSTSGFQSGALEFAKAHGIAAVQLVDGRTNYFTRSVNGPAEPPPWLEIEPIIGWLIDENRHSLVSRRNPEHLRNALADEPHVP